MTCIHIHNAFNDVVEGISNAFQHIETLEVVQAVRSAITELFQKIIRTLHPPLSEPTKSPLPLEITPLPINNVSQETNRLAIHTLATIFQVLLPAIDDINDIFSLTTTCKGMNNNRWGQFALNTKTLEKLFTKALAIDSTLPAPITLESILDKFPSTACHTSFSLIKPDSLSYTPQASILIKLVTLFPKMHRFDMNIHAKTSQEQLQLILSSCSDLQHLRLRGASKEWQITFPTQLKTVDIEPVPADSVQQLLNECNQLEEINLSGWEKPEGLDFTKISNTLKKIDLSKSTIADSDLAQITTACSQLKVLLLTNCSHITPAGLASLSFPDSLILLWLDGTAVDFETLKNIATKHPCVMVSAMGCQNLSQEQRAELRTISSMIMMNAD